MNAHRPPHRHETGELPASQATAASQDAPGTSRDERRQQMTRVLALIASVVGVSYLIWRAAFTLNPDALVLSWLLWTLEAHAILGLGVFTFSLWHITPSRTPDTGLPDGKVAVFIATYNEPPEVLTPVIDGAVALHGAHETWVLDDGNRAEIRALAESLGARYLARPDNTDAKAGNLNHALSIVDADFVAVLDADHVPHADFLVNTLPYLNDPGVALVQTPQDFYNEDSFEHVDARRQSRHGSFTEQSLFYRVIQPAKNRWESAFWCGTGAVLRTAALREIGGVATESLTEDLQTTIRLHRAGWKSRYHDEVLARGLAAPTADEYQSQRRRWCIGAIQTLRFERPLTDRSLSGEQRLSYAATILAWFDSVRVLGLLVLPAMVLLTGQAPIAAPLWTFLIVFATTFLLQQWAMVRLGRGQLRPIASTVFDLVRLQATFGALYTALTGREIEFSVTPKGRSSDAVRRIRVPRLLIVISALYLVAFCFYLATIAGLTGLEYGTPGVAHGAAFWLVFGGVILWLSIQRIHALDFAPERRGSHRHVVHATAQLDGQDAVVTDLSLTGARVALVGEAPEPRSGTPIDLRIEIGSVQAALTADVVAIERHADGRSTVRAAFHDGQWAELARLTEGLFHPASPSPIQREPNDRHLHVA